LTSREEKKNGEKEDKARLVEKKPRDEGMGVRRVIGKGGAYSRSRQHSVSDRKD